MPAALAATWRRGQTPLQVSEAFGPAHTLTWDFWPPDSETTHVPCFKPPGLWNFVMAATVVNESQGTF